MLGLDNKDKRRAPPVVPGLNIEGGTIAGRYRVEELLGAGSSGFVVAARHVYLRRRVTLKILASTTSQHQQAQRRHLVAAHKAAALRGRHVAKIVDTGFAENGMPFIATERLEGRTLAEELAERHALPPAEAIRWVLQACEGLAEAHSAGIVHGDLKPQNLFLANANATSTASTEDGEGASRVLKILDFGMATPADDRDDEGTGAWFASPAYLAPEQIRDPLNVDARADVWALGMILHELIAGRLPFTADTVSGMLVAVAHDEPAMLVGPSGEQGVPFELARIAHACLSKDPNGRPADVAELAKALAPFAGADGLAQAKRVETALSTPPDVTMTVEPDEGRSDAAFAAKPAPSPDHADARPAPSPSAHDQNRRTRAIERRVRVCAVATVGLAALLALVGLLAPASPVPSAASAREVAGPSAPSLAAAVPVPVLPPRPPSLLVEQPPRPPPTITAEPSGPPAPAPPPAPPLRLKRAPRTDPSSTPAAGGRMKQVSPPRPRAALSVREDPYARGFTHPTSLSERRK